jgi:hypothetical protein
MYKDDPSINTEIGHGDSCSNVSLPESSVKVETMASTSRSSHKTVEDKEIFQVLEESTDSDVTIFSSEEDEDGNEPDSDEDGLYMQGTNFVFFLNVEFINVCL